MPARGPGRPPIAAKDRRVLVAMRLPPAAYERLRALSEALDVSQSDVVTAALEVYAGRRQGRL